MEGYKLMLLIIVFFAENLTSLIDCALEENVTFVYAISPGLDMSFSSAKDIAFLKRKLDQVGYVVV